MRNLSLALILPIALIAASQSRADTTGPSAEEAGTTSTIKADYTLFNPTPTNEMRAMATDRVGLSRTPYTVDAGHFQLEMDAVNYSNNRIDLGGGATVKRQSFALAPVTAKAGLTNELELAISMETYLSSRLTDSAGKELAQASGFGDTRARVKWNFTGNDSGDFAMALVPSVKLPTSRDGVGNTSVEGGILAPIMVMMPSDWKAWANVGLDYDRNAFSKGRHFELTTSFSSGKQLTEEIDWFAGIASQKSYETSGAWMASVGTGVGFSPARDMRLDAGLNAGLTDDANDVNPYLGAAFRF